MPEVNHIKNLRNNKSLSINEISKRTGLCWSTVKKYADDDQLTAEKTPLKKGMMYKEKWGEIVSDWLMEDRTLKKKLRLNNTIIFDQLEALGFPGSYRTVCNFIKEWNQIKINEADEYKEEYERLLCVNSGRGIKDGIVITLGTGVGGVIIIDGKPHQGIHFRPAS